MSKFEIPRLIPAQATGSSFAGLFVVQRVSTLTMVVVSRTSVGKL
jgi:hypothetical protein